MIKKGLIASLALVAVIFALAGYGWMVTPAGADIPMHWGLDGAPDRYGTKLEAFGFMPGLSLALVVLFAMLPVIDPRGDNLRRSRAPFLIGWIGALVVLVGVQALITLTATGLISMDFNDGPAARILAGVVAAVIIAIGNVLGKARPNWFVGVRTPWTLSSDYSWDKTHRLTGRLFVLAGLISLVAAVVAPTPWVFGTLLVTILGATLIGVVMSYVWWKRDPVRETRSAAANES